jgi:hypothetical protein
MIPYDKFTAKGDVRTYLNQPFNHGDYTLASDGHTILLSPIDHAFDGIETPLKLDKIIEAITSTPVSPLDQPITLPEKSTCTQCQGSGKQPATKDCPECEGEGEVHLENDYSEYHRNCKTCKGLGQIKTGEPDEACEECNGTGKAWIASHVAWRTDGAKMDTVKIGDGTYNPEYIEKIIDLPDLKIGLNYVGLGTPSHPALIFESGNQRGAIMGLHV